MRLLGNIIWFILGGFFSFLAYLWGGFLLCLTIIGIPWGLQAMKIGIAHLTPFGRRVVSTKSSIPVLSFLLNIIWLLFAGIWIAIAEFVLGLLLCITILGIPFGIQHFKLMRLALYPFGYDLK
ncbi:MAG: YccF domain-containing protein [Bacteroidia bacterium]|nr:YccF domain-containing protein [Bacteroidia bacterium]